MIDKIADTVMRYGVTKKEYDQCMPQIKRSNRIMLAIFCWVISLFFFGLLLIEGKNGYTIVRITMFAATVLIGLFIWKKGEKSLLFMRIAIYTTLVLMFLATGYQGTVLSSNMYASSILLALAAFPVLLVDCPIAFFGISLLSSMVFLYVAWNYKAEAVRLGDTYNVLLAFVWGMIGHYGLGTVRIKGMLDRAELHRRDKRSEEVMKYAPVGICVMQLTPKQEFLMSYCSASFLEICRMTQKDADRIYKGGAYAGVHPNDRDWVRASIEQHTGEDSFSLQDFRLATGDGKYIWVSVVLRQNGTSGSNQSYYVVVTNVTKEHNLKAQLNDSQRRFDIALANSDLQIWEYDLLHNRCINSDKAGKIYGAPRVMENFPECLAENGKIDAKTLEIYMDMKQRLMAGEKEVSADVRLIDASGNWHWRRIEYHLEEDDNGRPLRAIGCSREITEQKELEEKYNAQLAYRNNIAKNSLFSMRVDLDENEIFEYTCTEPQLEACVTDGITASALMELFAGNAMEEEQPGSSRHCLSVNELQEAFDRGEGQAHARYKCRLLHIYVNLEVSILKNPGTGHREAFLVFTDVNDSCMTQKALGAVVNASYDFVGIADTTTGVFFALLHSENSTALSKQYDSYDVATKQLADSMKEQFLTEEDYRASREDVAMDHVIAQLQEEPLYEFNVRMKGDESGAFTYRLSFCYIDEERTQILVSQTNMTKTLLEEEKNQQMLAAALQAAEQASLAKSEFLSRMSHEIRTPMNAIIGISTLAVNDVKDPAMISEDLSKIIMSARYLLSLINDILDMSRIESGRMSLNSGTIIFDEFVSGINNIIYSQCVEKGVDYDVVVNGFMESAYIGDSVKLQQILVNVLGNSVKFTPKGGKITLLMEQLKQEAERATLRFTISDTGIGIDEEFIPHLFSPFEQESTGNTTSYGGTGLGLAITKNMVEMMDGHIEVHSIKGVGSEFVIEVKLGISEEAARNALLKAQMQLPELNTLVVDDDIVVCQNAQKILRKMGLKCEWITSGVGAIEYVQKHRAGNDDYDLILLDWKMPGMDGIETAREIRKIVGDDVTIIIMTAYDWSQIEKTARAAGVNMFMQKPLFQTTLLSAFRKIYGDSIEEVVPEEPEYHLEGKRILLVEDHPMNTEIAKRLLTSKGLVVTDVTNGLEAIERFSEAPAGYFDAILMDVRMPVMDGLTAAAHIRRLQKEGSKTIPIIAMTANAFEEDVKKSRESGMDAHLAKPIEADLLFGTLARFIG